MDLCHTTALSNLALFGSLIGATLVIAELRVSRLKRRLKTVVEQNNDLAASNANLYGTCYAFYRDAVEADQRALDAEAIADELKIDMGDLSQELAAAKVEMTETNTVCDAYARQCQATDDVVQLLTGVVQASGVAYLVPATIVEAQTESLIRVSLRKEASRGPGALGLASDLEAA